MGIGTTELIVILVIVVFLFGASRIPALAEAVGKGVRAFKRGIRGDEIDVTPHKGDQLPGGDSSQKTEPEADKKG
ncbi:MAG: twin-arginine translocase TatA/TatE family subunit [Deltaproteobacteria bacterium]|nr:twin-arginine translocase TatA/TatE family subunit [Deltaproteobacteria bacterium]